MASASLVDYLSEKFYSLSSKMWGSSLQPSSTSFLMSGNSNLQQYDLSAVLGEVRDKIDYQIAINPTYQFLPLHRFTTGIFGGLKMLNGLYKPNNYMSYTNMTEKGFLPYSFNSVTDSYRPKCGPYDSSLMSSDSKFPNPAKESVLSESCITSQKTDTMKKEKVNPQVIEMTVDVSHLPTEEKCGTVKENCDISPTVRLNIELAHRKTKEMSKRSKKRRRRQKKSEQLNVSNSASDDEDANNECSAVTDSVCFLSKSPDFGCTLSVTQTIQFSPRNSFLIPVTSDSEDDSEWETFEKIEISAANSESSSEINSGDSSSSSNSSPVKCESLKSSSFKPSVHVSSIISFVVPENDSDDDDSDWDTCETSTSPENTEFELSGLYFTTLCAPQSYYKYKNDCNSDFTSEADSEENLQQRADILEANSKWNNLDSQASKSASKVTFAPDEDLVQVFPVDIFERKGEWEMYATARDRFKRKISELEKVISPCLMPEHRSKIFKKRVEPEL